MSIWRRIKVHIGKYLEELAGANKKTFGTTPPDCCRLNRKDEPPFNTSRPEAPAPHRTQPRR
jgi:hypothetical protein